jgi:hypothetical protein
MDYEIILTVLFAAAAVVLAFAVCARILKARLAAVLVILPLAASIPWAKQFPALGDAVSLFAALGVLWLWLDVQSKDAARLRRPLVLLGVLVALRPEILFLALAAVLLEGWRRRRDVAVRRTLLAACGACAVALVSAVAVHFVYSPVAALEGIRERLLNGAAWDGTTWTLAGTDVRNSIKPAATFGVTFYLPLLVPFLILSLPRRGDWWFAPLFAWGAVIFVLTMWQVQTPILRACPTLQAALLLPFGTAAIFALRRSPVRVNVQTSPVG